MNELEDGARAFSTFRVLKEDSDVREREQLFRNMAQLYAYVSTRCDDEQVSQYDDVLCQLAELVEARARSHVAKLLAPLERAPGNVVVKLANDSFAVAQPLLEFSNVLSDDDLIEIVANRSEAHRVAIAGRQVVTERVGEAIVEHGQVTSVSRLVRNANAELGERVLTQLAERAAREPAIVADLRGRDDIDWDSVNEKIRQVGGNLMEALAPKVTVDPETNDQVSAVVYNRLRNRAGFSSQEWKLAYNQVKALADRRQLDHRALTRFARFGYGHHIAAALAILLKLSPDTLVKWLAMQDYGAMTVALKAYGVSPDLFEAMIAAMPWRDLPSRSDLDHARRRFENFDEDEASGIFELWREHAFRRRVPADNMVGAA